MKTLLFLSVLVSGLGFSTAFAAGEMHICYFSLNEAQEFQATKEFMDKLNQVSPTKIIVTEYQPQGGKPEDAFRKMIESGVKCDGLVISGHHTGSYGGKRAGGKGPAAKLSMDYLEKLSCDPKYADFFRGINATWLQGCRTLGIGEIEANDEEAADADFHTGRVGEALEEDNLNQNFAELNMEFSNTLDQDNPLASRYLRIFPEAKVFGWTKTAPGTKAKSWMSILFHMAQTARLMNAQDKYPADAPDAPVMTAASAAQYANAVLFTLKKFGADQKGCEDVAVSSWLAQGNVGLPGKYFFDNPDLRAFPSLASTGDQTLMQAKEIDCLLKSGAATGDTAKVSRALDMIAAQPDFLRYSFNTIVDMRNELAKTNSPLAKQILDRMRTLPAVNNLLASKLQSNQVGILRKIDYYQFSRLLTGKSDPTLETEVANRAVEVLMQPLPALDPTAAHPDRSRKLAADYRATLFQAMIKNKMAGPDFYDKLIGTNPEADVLTSMALASPRFNPDDTVMTLLQVAAAPNANRTVAAAILKTMQSMQIPQAEIDSYAQSMQGIMSKGDGAMIKFKDPTTNTVRQLPSDGGLY